MINNTLKFFKRSNITYVAVSLTLVFSFAFDLSISLGVAAGVLYVIPVLLTLNLKSKNTTYIVASLGVVLTIIGFVASPSGGDIWKVLINRILAIFSIVSAGIVIVLVKKKNAELVEQTKLAQDSEKIAIKSNQAKSDFLSSMSHEVRTP
ncbi:MAG: hypothetical protein OEW63_05025 [Gammaproteobacteria bacterium]|nr:hypothetical protein [Gammaproteobacteria bacterium]